MRAQAAQFWEAGVDGVLLVALTDADLAVVGVAGAVRPHHGTRLPRGRHAAETATSVLICPPAATGAWK